MIRLIISGTGIALAGAIFFVYTQPTYDKTQTIRAQIKEYDQALSKAAELQKLKDTLLSRLNAFNPADIDRLQKLLPDHVDNVRLILDMDQMASKRGMALDNVDISKSDTTQTTTIGAIGTDTTKYESLLLKFGTTGTYNDFLVFMSDLQSSLRIVDLVDLNFEPTGSSVLVPGANQPEPTYRFALTLKTYWLK